MSSISDNPSNANHGHEPKVGCRVDQVSNGFSFSDASFLDDVFSYFGLIFEMGWQSVGFEAKFQ